MCLWGTTGRGGQTSRVWMLQKSKTGGWKKKKHKEGNFPWEAHESGGEEVGVTEA